MKRTILLIIICLVVLTEFSSCAVIKRENRINTTDGINTEGKKIYAVWVSYNELSMKSETDKSEKAFAEKAENIMKNCNQNGFNRVIVQVRPFSDAFYRSEFFPFSEYLSGKQGVDPGYDALKLLCDAAKRYNLKIDAWINPYRVSYDTDFTKLSPDNPAVKLIEHGNYDDVIVLENGVFYNPASQKVQQLVLDGIREILENYSIDGIHIDDYFYPSRDESFDKNSYDAYIGNGGDLSLDNWRRSNVNTLVSLIYSTVKSYSQECLFTVSPCGDIDKNYNDYYADVKLWLSESGYCDIIMPQLYYGFNNENKPFEKTLESWTELRKCDGVLLCPGLAFYKYKTSDRFAGSGSNEWLENEDIISRQVSKILTNDKCNGFSLYSFSYIFGKNNDEICKKELQKIKNMLE